MDVKQLKNIIWIGSSREELKKFPEPIKDEIGYALYRAQGRIMQKKIEFKKSSGNIFKDLGLTNPEERLTKAKIASMIYDIIEKRKLTQKEAGAILGVSQPKISALRNGRLDGFSMERLFYFLRALDQDVDIVVHPKIENEAHLTLAYANG